MTKLNTLSGHGQRHETHKIYRPHVILIYHRVMTRAKLNTAIEKNRKALLRIVLWWLAVASLFRAKQSRVLPHRLGLWVSDFIFKSELAAYYLQIAAHGCVPPWMVKPVRSDAPIAIGEVLIQLKTIKKTLVALRHMTKWLLAKHWTMLPTRQMRKTHVPRLSAVQIRGFLPAVCCRAPPVSSFCSAPA